MRGTNRPACIAAAARGHLLRVAGVGLLMLWLLAGPNGAGASALSEGDRAVPSLEVVLSEPGPALRAAVSAMNEGESVLADALLAAIAKRHPLIADYADLLRMRLRVQSRRIDDAIALGERWSHADSPVRAEFYTLLGRAYAARGDEGRARAAWEYATLATGDREQLVALHQSIADSYQRSGDLERAADTLLLIWTRYPEQPGAETAEAGLAQIERQERRAVRSASHYRQRGNALYRALRNEEALAAYDQALSLGLRGREAREVRNSRAETLFRLRRYPEAAEAFASLPSTEERRIQRARAQARSGQVHEAARQLENMGSRSKTGQGTRALLIAALLYDGEDEQARARGLYATIVRRAPSSGSAEVSRWNLAWDDYRRGRYAEAIAYFDEIERREDDPIGRLRPRYWRIRAAEARGDPGTTAAYTALAREFPLSYYGWRARGRAGAIDASRVPPRMDPGRAALSPSELARPRILLEAGLVSEARAELDALFQRAVGVEDRLALAALYANAGDFHRPQRLMVDAYTERLARGPDPDHPELWWHAWPVPFADEMRGATLDGLKVSPELVYSIMREESGYRPEVVSVSGARGLLQLMPTTAERVARSVKLDDFTADDLFLPRVNIQLGADYLSGLVRRFEGQTSAAIGSYNAGPQAVSRWVSEDQDDDVWVEEIPYGQTRGYVKRVLRSLHAYRVLY
jgi:soluble lytic murein transglycosylase